MDDRSVVLKGGFVRLAFPRPSYYNGQPFLFSAPVGGANSHASEGLVALFEAHPTQLVGRLEEPVLSNCLEWIEILEGAEPYPEPEETSKR